jgi:hypothetical protein
MVTEIIISLDVSGNTPAEVKAVLASLPAEIQQPQAVQQTQLATESQNQAMKRNFQDISELAKGINPNILSGSYPL